MRKPKRKQRVERYPIGRSPLSQNPTQQQLASLLGTKKGALKGLAKYRESWIVRREQEINGKVRKLAYPIGKLRVVHEKLKYHCKKVQQPTYLLSPRKGKSQRDNAEQHLSRNQYLTIDIKQFYPSTTAVHVREWLTGSLGMRSDTANLFTDLVTIDGAVSFGSPLTPVLTTLIHRAMFDEIFELCQRRGLNMSLWVDDITISGHFVPGTLLENIREVIRKNGLKSHKLKYYQGNRTVYITGIGIVGDRLVSPRTTHEKIRELYSELYESESFEEYNDTTTRLLSALGTVRFIAGASSEHGRKAASQMNSLRQKREKQRRRYEKELVAAQEASVKHTPKGEIPWE